GGAALNLELAVDPDVAVNLGGIALAHGGHGLAGGVDRHHVVVAVGKAEARRRLVRRAAGGIGDLRVRAPADAAVGGFALPDVPGSTALVHPGDHELAGRLPGGRHRCGVGTAG